MAHRLEDIDGTVAILNVGGMDKDKDQEAASISENMAFASFDLLTRTVAANPPLSVVLTDWLSMTPALGGASRPRFRAGS